MRLTSEVIVMATCMTWAATIGSVDASVPLIDGLGGPQGWGENCLSPTDDGSSAPIDLTPAFPSGLRFFTDTYTSLFINTNGNVTFRDPLATYTPSAFPHASREMIAPYWAGVDTRFYGGWCHGGAGTSEPGDGPCHNPENNGVWWYMEPGRMIITWHDVGYYSCHVDLRMGFQLVLVTPEGCSGDGDFDIEFRYARCDWTTGDSSGGTGGLGGTAAQAGYDAGNGVDYFEVPGSRTVGIRYNVCNESNVDTPGRWLFQIRSGTGECPEEIPDVVLPDEFSDIGMDASADVPPDFTSDDEPSDAPNDETFEMSHQNGGCGWGFVT